jgi:hypothetical protein
VAEPKTTTPGYVNRNGQIVIRKTELPGTDHLQTVYQLGCSKCGYVYGANGSDIHLRRLCPECQKGAKGLPYEYLSADPRHAEIWLSTKVRVRRYLQMEAAEDKQGIADFIVHRFRERYIIPLQNVRRGEENGFLIMAASCLLIEGFTAFREGWPNTKGKSKIAFQKFFSDEAGFSELKEFDVDFWGGIRCGILHRGETDTGWRLDFTHNDFSAVRCGC